MPDSTRQSELASSSSRGKPSRRKRRSSAKIDRGPVENARRRRKRARTADPREDVTTAEQVKPNSAENSAENSALSDIQTLARNNTLEQNQAAGKKTAAGANNSVATHPRRESDGISSGLAEHSSDSDDYLPLSVQRKALHNANNHYFERPIRSLPNWSQSGDQVMNMILPGQLRITDDGLIVPMAASTEEASSGASYMFNPNPVVNAEPAFVERRDLNSTNENNDNVPRAGQISDNGLVSSHSGGPSPVASNGRGRGRKRGQGRERLADQGLARAQAQEASRESQQRITRQSSTPNRQEQSIVSEHAHENTEAVESTAEGSVQVAADGSREPESSRPRSPKTGQESIPSSATDVFPGATRRARWSSAQDDALLRLVEHFGTKWPTICKAWRKAGLDKDGGKDAPKRSSAAMRQRYYLLMGHRPGKKAPPRRRHLDRWEVQDDLDLLEAINAGGEGFGEDGTVESACASLSRTLNARPLRPVRTDMSVYNRVRRLALRKGMSIFEFLGIQESVYSPAWQREIRESNLHNYDSDLDEHQGDDNTQEGPRSKDGDGR